MVIEAAQLEGGDITAADMIAPEEKPSEVESFYANSTIFITGATGFLGKVLMEKLLKDCNDLTRIYVLVRPKKGKDVQTRFEEIFEGPSMEPLKRKHPNFRSKVTLLSGDCALPNLGLNHQDHETLVAETNVVFHCAATVRFDEKLRTATNINVRSVIDLMKIAKKMKNLRAVIYMSTAFSNCVRQQIDEVFYPPPITSTKLNALLEAIDDDTKLEKITPLILEGFPNTYVFSKSVAEDVIRTEGKSLPVVIVRPSIVISSVKDPVAGWIDNLYGATGVLIGAALGVLRSLYAKKENCAEMIPADYVTNCTLAAGWDIATMKTINENKEKRERDSREALFEKEVPIYNLVSTPESRITWDNYMKLSEKYAKQIPSPLLVWHYCFALRSSRLQHLIAVFFLHTIPAYIADFACLCLGKKPMMVKGYQKINKFSEVISYFSSREWQFSNNNVQALWEKLGKRDQELFQFSMKSFNWDAYFHTYTRGARIYLLKDPMDTLKQGAVRYYKLMVLHYTVVGVLFLLLLKVLSYFYNILL